MIGSIAAEGTINALYLINCDNYSTMKDLTELSAKRILAGVSMVILTKVIVQGVNDGNMVLLFAEVIGGGMTYALMLILLHDNLILY